MLEGLDGTQKVWKSLGNQVGIYGSSTDVGHYYEPLSTESPAPPDLVTQRGDGPHGGQQVPCRKLVSRFHDPPARADDAARFFAERFQQRSGNAPTPHRRHPGSVDMSAREGPGLREPPSHGGWGRKGR